jgi:serine/threonine protein kinase
VPAGGVVHRYLKPANVILAPDRARVLDFGIAHVADGTAVIRPGAPTGTPGWLSPEYHRDATAGRTEIFAWGVLPSRQPAATPSAPAFVLVGGAMTPRRPPCFGLCVRKSVVTPIVGKSSCQKASGGEE